MPDVKVQITFRKDTAANWLAANSVLALGEPGYETDTGRFKVGNGVLPWLALPYSSGQPGPAGDKGDPGDAGASIQYAGFTNSSYSLSLLANSRTLLPLTGLIKGVESDAFPGHDFFAGGVFNPLDAAGKYRLRLNVDLSAQLIDAEYKFEMDIGGSFGVIDTDQASSTVQAGEVERITPSFDFYNGTTFEANGGTIYVQSSVQASISRLAAIVTVERP